MTNIIIKNKNKFSKIKLAKGIYLDNYSMKEGVVLKVFSSPQGKLYYKAFATNLGMPKEMRIVNELLCEEIGKQIGLKMAHYQPANYKGKVGLVSLDITKDGEVLFDGERLAIYQNQYSGNTYDQYIELLDLLEQRGYKVHPSTKLDLYKLLVFDTLTFQEDRHNSNILFLEDTITKQIRLAPILDNEFPFGGFQENVVYDQKGINAKYFLQNHGKNIDYTAKTIPLYASKNRYIDNIKQIIALASVDENKKALLIEALKNVDFKKAIESVKQKGYEIPYDYEFYILELEKIAKDCYKKQIKKQSEITK